MTEAAGTPDPKATVSATTPPAPEVKDDSGQVTVSAQFKKEALENWKPAAEKVNKLEADLQAANARLEQLSRMAYGGGQQATDPDAEAYKQALAQAEFDPVARLAVIGANKAVKAEAEAWLTDELDNLGDALTTSKRKQVAALIRANGYQLSADRALKLVTDPDTKTFAEQLESLKNENERLKNAKPNGVSPAATPPATASADDGAPQNMKMSDYIETLQRASSAGATDEEVARARLLKQAAGNNKLKLERE